jgi:hypothetical protein
MPESDLTIEEIRRRSMNTREFVGTNVETNRFSLGQKMKEHLFPATRVSLVIGFGVVYEETASFFHVVLHPGSGPIPSKWLGTDEPADAAAMGNWRLRQ